MFNLGMSEIMVILVLALVFLGPKKLPELASGLGRMIREVRKATADIKQEIELDETIRKPLEELREATMLPPEELKRRDRERAEREVREREDRERAEREPAMAAEDDHDHADAYDPQEHAPEEPDDYEDPSLGEDPPAPVVAVSPPAEKTAPLSDKTIVTESIAEKTVVMSTSPVPASASGPPPGLFGKPAGAVPRGTLIGMAPGLRSSPPTPSAPPAPPAAAAGSKLPPPPTGTRPTPEKKA